MSFELSVFVPRADDQLLPRWLSLLAQKGLACEFFPGFSLDTWPGGYLPVRLRVLRPDAFPDAARYGSSDLLAGFEIDVVQAASNGLFGWFRTLFRKSAAPLHVAFRTAMGRSVADLRLQCMAAAALSAATDGVYCDPQRGTNLRGAQALEAALAEARVFEASPVAPEDWELTPFPGWEAVS